MNPRDFLDTANHLATQGIMEADFRCAIRTGYYAAFHVVKERTRARYYYDHLNVHDKALDAIKNGSQQWPREYVNDFETLRRARRRADYELNPTIPQSDAARFVKLAQEFVAGVDSSPLLR